MKVQLEISIIYFLGFPEGGQNILLLFLKDALGVIVVFDLTRQDNFTKLDNWFEHLVVASKVGLFPRIYLVGTKADLEITMNQNTILNFIRNWETKLGRKITFFFTSAKEGWYKSPLQTKSRGIEDFFCSLTIDLLKSRERENEKNKVVLLGDYRAGKTTLTHRGLGNDFTTVHPIADGFSWTIYSKEFDLEQHTVR